MVNISVTTSVVEKGKNAPKWDLDLDLGGEATLEDFVWHVKAGLIKISDIVLKEEQDNGFDKQARRRVDNKWDRPKELVKPFGKIEYYARQNALEAIPMMYEMIEKRSPVVTGQYISANYVFHNERLVATNRASLKTWIEAKKKTGLGTSAKIRFVNVMPYAMRLELKGVRSGTAGKTRGVKLTKPISKWSKKTEKIIKKPNGAYTLAARAIRNRFKGVGSFIKYATIPNGYNGISIKPSAKFRTSYHESNRKYKGPYVYPSIVLDFSREGALLQ